MDCYAKIGITFQILLSILFKIFPVSGESACPSSSSSRYAKVEETVQLQFQVDVNAKQFVGFDIKAFNRTKTIAITYLNGVNFTALYVDNNVNFVGDYTTGDLSFEIPSVRIEDGGGYFLIQDAVTTIKCITLYVLGVPQKPVITPDNNNVVGLNTTLTCSSKSTTKPNAPKLSLNYTWTINNPDDTRYVYSQTKHTLTINRLRKNDSGKTFTCTATESGDGTVGETSASSNAFVLVLIYGPDASTTTLSPATLSYTRNEGDRLNDITCSGDCYPSCKYQWTKSVGNRVVSNSQKLSLGQLTRAKAANYTCTVTNANRTVTPITKTVTVIVKYGPDANTTILSPSNSVYTKNEGENLNDVTCSGTCYPSCDYKWTKPGTTGAVEVSNNKVLSLGSLDRTEAAKYTCTVTNPDTGQTQTKQITVYVRYGPDLHTTTLSPTKTTYTLLEGSILPDITCVGDCYPACSYRWTKPGNTEVGRGDTLSLGSLTRGSATVYMCLVTNTQKSGSVTKNVTVNVIYGPDTNSVTLDPKPTTYVLNEQSTLADITCWADCYPTCNFKWMKASTNHQVSSTQKLQLGALNRNEADTYTCTATNPTSRKNAMKSVIVNVRYGPDRCEVSVPSQYRITEGKTPPDIVCKSECYPACSYKWKNISDGTFISQTGTFRLGRVSREQAGNYRCFCRNTASQYEKEENTSISMIVQYPPDVNIKPTTSEYVEGKPLNLTCDAKGIPSAYNYNGLTQTFGGFIIHNGHSSVSGTSVNSSLHIPSLQLKDTGNYTCYVNNGVKLPSGELRDSVSSTFVGVQVHPKVLTRQLRFAGATDETAFIQVKLYSYPDLKKVTFVRYDGTTITDVSSSKYEIDIYKTVVEDYFYSTLVSLDGSFLNMTISNLQQDDFGNYTLVLENEIGTTNATIFLDAESVPSEPKYFVYSYEDNSHKFFWFGGFNGGHSQKFVIQTSIAGLDEWINQTSISENDQTQYSANISYLSPGTYTARMFAWNIKGPSKYVLLNETFTVEEEDISKGDMSAVIGGVAGGSSALIIIIIVIVVVVILKRRGVFSKGKGHAHDDKNDRQPVYADENDYGMQDNPMYVSAGPREQKAGGSGVGDGTVYSTVNKKKLVDSSKNDVYAEVDKSKKTKANKDLTDNEYSTPVKPKGKEKKEKGKMKDKKGKKMMQEGDLYENAATTELKTTQKNHDETIYENPEPSKQAKKKNVNKDGLIYADLTFNDQPKGQKKLVIHGLDSMTEYVEVDFTKKADPLPDSDDESNQPEK